MLQSGLFNDVQTLELPHGTLTWYRAWLDEHEAADYFSWCSEQLQWSQPDIRIAGRTLPIPRLQAWYGDRGASYTFSSKQFQPTAWPDKLWRLKEKIEVETQHAYNSVLANLYRDGEDSVSWHADDEPELGGAPVIASLSLGATRGFLLKPKNHAFQHKTLRLDLAAGDLLLMHDTVQQFWQHAIPKTKRCSEPRINLTFREIHSLK